MIWLTKHDNGWYWSPVDGLEEIVVELSPVDVEVNSELLETVSHFYLVAIIFIINSLIKLIYLIKPTKLTNLIYISWLEVLGGQLNLSFLSSKFSLKVINLIFILIWIMADANKQPVPPTGGQIGEDPKKKLTLTNISDFLNNEVLSDVTVVNPTTGAKYK